MSERHAIVLLSGGLDSTTVLAIARSQGFICHTLAVSYGQRHSVELQAASKLSRQLGAVEHRQMHVDLADIGGSALTDSRIAVPESATTGIPVTYVPARNTLFLALALGWAEVTGSRDIFIGVNAVDYSGYPDCRPEFIRAFEALAALATKAGVEGGRFQVRAPLVSMSKRRSFAPAPRWEWTTARQYPATRPTTGSRPVAAAIPAACGARVLRRRACRTLPATPEADTCLIRYHAPPLKPGR